MDRLNNKQESHCELLGALNDFQESLLLETLKSTLETRHHESFTAQIPFYVAFRWEQEVELRKYQKSSVRDR